jgi:hypothetical protein
MKDTKSMIIKKTTTPLDTNNKNVNNTYEVTYNNKTYENKRTFNSKTTEKTLNTTTIDYNTFPWENTTN